jgi:hypothetical protein
MGFLALSIPELFPLGRKGHCDQRKMGRLEPSYTCGRVYLHTREEMAHGNHTYQGDNPNKDAKGTQRYVRHSNHD